MRLIDQIVNNERFIEKMKSVTNYHLVATGLIVVLVFVFSGHIEYFVLSMFIYAFLFRPFVDKARLIALELYEGEGYWRLFWVTRWRYYGQLMFGLTKD